MIIGHCHAPENSAFIERQTAISLKKQIDEIKLAIEQTQRLETESVIPLSRWKNEKILTSTSLIS